MQYIILLSELIILYLFSHILIDQLFRLFILTFHNRPVAISLVSAILFPGTVTHELAHLFTASVLGVRTGKLTLVPETLQQRELQLGSVAITETDPFRRVLIGLAPVFWGILTLSAIAYFLPGLWQNVQTDYELGLLFSRSALYLFLIALYALFAVSNSMFASRDDLRGVWPVLLSLAFVGIAAWFAGFQLVITGKVLEVIIQITQTLTKSLGLVLAVNTVILLIVNVLITTVSKVTKRMIKK